VSKNSAGLLKFESRGVFKGACYLRCHYIEHNPKTY
jgi:hypothetical protein